MGSKFLVKGLSACLLTMVLMFTGLAMFTNEAKGDVAIHIYKDRDFAPMFSREAIVVADYTRLRVICYPFQDYRVWRVSYTLIPEDDYVPRHQIEKFIYGPPFDLGLDREGREGRFTLIVKVYRTNQYTNEAWVETTHCPIVMISPWKLEERTRVHQPPRIVIEEHWGDGHRYHRSAQEDSENERRVGKGLVGLGVVLGLLGIIIMGNGQ